MKQSNHKSRRIRKSQSKRRSKRKSKKQSKRKSRISKKYRRKSRISKKYKRKSRGFPKVSENIKNALCKQITKNRDKETGTTFGFGSASTFTIYTKDGCPSCQKAKNLLSQKKIPYTVIRGEEINPNVNYPTWPKIYRHKNFIGGFTDLEKYFSN